MIKLGFVSSALPEFNGKKLYEIAVAEELGGFELQCWPTKRNRFNTYGYSQYEQTDGILALGYYPNWLEISSGEQHNAILCMCSLIDIANELSVPISTHAGANNSLSMSDNIGRLCELFGPIIRYAESRSVSLCMETSSYRNAEPFGTNIGAHQQVWDQWLALSPITMLTLDTAQTGRLLSTIETYRNRIGHIHARDIRHDTICSPGVGSIDWPVVFESLRDMDCAMVLEYDSTWWTSLPLNDRINEMHYCTKMLTGEPPRATGDYGQSPCQNMHNVAINYVDRGWDVVPILFRNKESGLGYWPDVKVTKENARDFFSGLQNIAVSFGGDLVDVDIDHPKAAELAPKFLPPTGAIFGRKSKPRSHYLYRSPNATPLNAKSWAVEIRCGRLAYTVMPPSVHISGETIEWHPGSNQVPSLVDGYDLAEAVRRLADAAISDSDFTWPC